MNSPSLKDNGVSPMTNEKFLFMERRKNEEKTDSNNIIHMYDCIRIRL